MTVGFSTRDLAVGYDRKILLQGINIRLEPGKILTLIGPNGAGKSTVLKTITRQLAAISGKVFIGDQEISALSMREFAKRSAVVLTEQVRPELMTCAEVVAMGRYPYTDMFGKLSEADKAAVYDALERVHAVELADQDLSTLSDGQRQRIMLARAICQDPGIIILDEPTAYLDIRYKIELLSILRNMAVEKGTVVIMSLHEIDLAMKVSDELICLDGVRITAYGSPEAILSQHAIEDLYGIREGSYNILFGSVEMPRPEGEPVVFVIAGNGKGTPVYRALQKRGIPFSTGILFENDIDCLTAEALCRHLIKVPAFEPIGEETINRAETLLRKCSYVLDAGTGIGSYNRANADLIALAEGINIPLIHSVDEVKA